MLHTLGKSPFLWTTEDFVGHLLNLYHKTYVTLNTELLFQIRKYLFSIGNGNCLHNSNELFYKWWIFCMQNETNFTLWRKILVKGDKFYARRIRESEAQSGNKSLLDREFMYLLEDTVKINS